MADLTAIYRSRQDIGLTRQPRHTRVLKKLDRILQSFLADQPYNFAIGITERDVIGKFKTLTPYKEGSAGYVARINDSEYLYRLSGIKKIAKSRGVVWHSHVKPDAPDNELFRLVEEDSKTVSGWINLSRYCSGYLCNDRNFTWWTSFHIDSLAVNESAHLLGLTNNWLDPHSVILRYPVASLGRHNGVRVPTVIDAYCSPVFHPTRDADKPKTGITISLTKSGELSPGVTEFVVKTAEVANIEMLPVLIPDRADPYFDSNDDPELWDLLSAYYTAF